jgi:hypothetical protein
MKKRNKLKSFIIICLLTVQGLSCSFHDPVSEDYYFDTSKIKGGEKPSPPPVISAVTAAPNQQTGVDIKIDFSGTATIDPDTGSADNLYYLFYISAEDPSLFTNEGSFYDNWFLYGYISHADLLYIGGGIMATSVVLEQIVYNGRLYFWMTAVDEGREADHSAVVYIDL